MVNMKVVEFFKSYIFYLWFTFNNSKIRALFKNFGLKSNFSKYLSLVDKFHITLDLIANSDNVMMTYIFYTLTPSVNLRVTFVIQHFSQKDSYF
jgi:hypothetical protein